LIVASAINFGVIFWQLNAAPPEKRSVSAECAHAFFRLRLRDRNLAFETT